MGPDPIFCRGLIYQTHILIIKIIYLMQKPDPIFYHIMRLLRLLVARNGYRRSVAISFGFL